MSYNFFRETVFNNAIKKFMASPIPSLRAVQGMLLRLMGQVTWNTIDIHYRSNCNFSCEHCFAHNFMTSEKDTLINIDDLRRIAKEAKRVHTLSIQFQGGEPLLWPELPDLIQAVSPKTYCVGIVTNGYLLTSKKAKELKKSGLSRMCISIDSGLESEHDKFRGQPGSLNKCFEAVDHALNAGIVPIIFNTVWKGRTKDKGFLELYEYAKRRKIQMFCVIAMPVGNWSGNLDVLVSRDDLKELDRLHNECQYCYRDVYNILGHVGCKAVINPYILSTGDVLPCPFIHISLGNIRFEPIDKILRRGLKIDYFYPFSKICLTGEKGSFLDKVMPKIFNAKKLPLNAEDVFDLSSDLPRRS